MAGNLDLRQSSSGDLATPDIQLSTTDDDATTEGESSLPRFESALAYARVRDFAYPEFHPLHYGVPQPPPSASSSDEGRYLDDGPPWQEDADLASPVIKSHDVGDRISREYEFSVASADEIHGRAVALFDFTPENENEAPLREGQLIWVSYRHGQGWLVAEDPDTGETGLVPEEYVELIPNHEARRIHEAQLAAAAAQQHDNDNDNDDNNSSNNHNSNVNTNINNDGSPDSFHSPQALPEDEQQHHQHNANLVALSNLDLNKP
ncbi:hypothetical protein TRICI_004288 [Trichomonascus ciferrii]|uniref:SH3 domain-containing protein n=1 Tax=Trichomonascus ciferrii TaxID=44093 RepID=A0A642V0Q5_9ASCO|nr:hypothetical protein TRICI_004288 [Trichomonascus ciferrii]